MRIAYPLRRGGSAAFAIAAALALSACESITAVQRDGTFVLQVGDRAKVTNGDFIVRFVSVSQDSRCPEGAMCVWEGDAVVELDVYSSGRWRTYDLHTNSTQGPVSLVRDGRVLELIELTPVPRAGRPIDQRDYTARLRISSY